MASIAVVEHNDGVTTFVGTQKYLRGVIEDLAGPLDGNEWLEIWDGYNPMTEGYENVISVRIYSDITFAVEWDSIDTNFKYDSSITSVKFE